MVYKSNFLVNNIFYDRAGCYGNELFVSHLHKHCVRTKHVSFPIRQNIGIIDRSGSPCCGM